MGAHTMYLYITRPALKKNHISVAKEVPFGGI